MSEEMTGVQGKNAPQLSTGKLEGQIAQAESLADQVNGEIAAFDSVADQWRSALDENIETIRERIAAKLALVQTVLAAKQSQLQAVRSGEMLTGETDNA